MGRTTVDAAVAGAVMLRMAKRGVSNADLAERVGLSEKALTNRFLCITPFKLTELERICISLECSLSDVMPPTNASRGVA